ncbi:MAG: DUF4301 family protein [Acidobacteriota bacterium]
MNKLRLNENDFVFLEKSGLGIEEINSQLDKLTRGNIPVSLLRPAGTDDGIIKFSNERTQELAEKYDKLRQEFIISKFVPASGAATRMFSEISSISTLIEKLPFSDELAEKLEKAGFKINQLISDNNSGLIEEYILSDKGLNYSFLPKALIKFHKYSDMSVTPFGEHFAESIGYTGNKDDDISIHFTIPEDRLNEFNQEYSVLKKMFHQNGYNISAEFSFQEKDTNTISLDSEGGIVRDENGNILLRAGGHGSLIKNLNGLSSDIIFIKNIDNITTIDRLSETIENKKVLGTYLFEIREKIFGSLRTIPRIIKDGESINEIYCFSKDVLNISFPSDFIEFELEKKKKILTEKLNRPIRVCGMVKNTNEPGGGPFWIENRKGEETLQIIEESQIDKNSPEQIEIFRSSSHFNPVDIVCSIKDFRGNNFNLEEFIEESRYFISEKTYLNNKINVIEHPGLWNGSMEKWISIFIEVPVSTFNPVKYVSDLLKENHRPSEDIAFSDIF